MPPWQQSSHIDYLLGTPTARARYEALSRKLCAQLLAFAQPDFSLADSLGSNHVGICCMLSVNLPEAQTHPNLDAWTGCKLNDISMRHCSSAALRFPTRFAGCLPRKLDHIPDAGYPGPAQPAPAAPPSRTSRPTRSDVPCCGALCAGPTSFVCCPTWSAVCMRILHRCLPLAHHVHAFTVLNRS